MLSRAALTLALLAGCASTIEPNGTQGTRSVDVVVSDQWSPEEAEQILAGVDFWRDNLSASRYTVRVSVGPCSVEAGDEGCIAPVAFEHPALRAYEDGATDNGYVVGSCVLGTIAMWEDMPLSDLDLLAAHELGHYLGLWHADPAVYGANLMAPGTGEMSFALTPGSEARLYAW